MKSQRPYLLRALYEWIVDSDEVPYVLVDANLEGVQVPAEHVQDGQIVLNIGPGAIRDLNIEDHGEGTKTDTIGGKIWYLVDKYYPTGRFTSTEILERYEDEFNEPIKLSVISTYLARFTTKNKVERAKKGREWTYQATRIPNYHKESH